MLVQSSGNTLNKRARHSYLDVHRTYYFGKDCICWDDLRFPAHGISLGAFTEEPDRQADTGLLLFDGTTAVETVAILAQMPHNWKIGSGVRPHLHWAKTTDAAGDVAWTIRYKWIAYDEIATGWSTLDMAVASNDVDATQKQIISCFTEISGDGYDISDMLLIQLGRLYTDAEDTYEADALLYEFDLHYQIDSVGSGGEYAK